MATCGESTSGIVAVYFLTSLCNCKMLNNMLVLVILYYVFCLTFGLKKGLVKFFITHVIMTVCIFHSSVGSLVCMFLFPLFLAWIRRLSFILFLQYPNNAVLLKEYKLLKVNICRMLSSSIQS